MHARYASVLLCFALSALPATAQMVFKGLGTSNSTFLLGNNSARRTQCIYLPGDLNNPVAGTILRLYYRYGTTGQTAGVTLGDLVIQLGQTEQTAFPNGNTYFTQLTTVFSATSYTIPPGNSGDWFPIELQLPYTYNPLRTLIIDIVFETSTTQNFGTLGTTNNGRKLYSNTGGTATGTTTSTTWQDMGFDLELGTGMDPVFVALADSRVYPNPFEGTLMVDLSADLPEDARVDVLDLAGRRVHSFAPKQRSGRIALDLGVLPAGIYLVHAQGAQGQALLGRVVKE
jgi:hypothetical protein